MGAYRTRCGRSGGAPHPRPPAFTQRWGSPNAGRVTAGSGSRLSWLGLPGWEWDQRLSCRGERRADGGRFHPRTARLPVVVSTMIRAIASGGEIQSIDRHVEGNHEVRDSPQLHANLFVLLADHIRVRSVLALDVWSVFDALPRNLSHVADHQRNDRVLCRLLRPGTGLRGGRVLLPVRGHSAAMVLERSRRDTFVPTPSLMNAHEQQIVDRDLLWVPVDYAILNSHSSSPWLNLLGSTLPLIAISPRSSP